MVSTATASTLPSRFTRFTQLLHTDARHPGVMNNPIESSSPTKNTDDTVDVPPQPESTTPVAPTVTPDQPADVGQPEGQTSTGDFAPPPDYGSPPGQEPPPEYGRVGWPEPGRSSGSEHGGVVGILRKAMAAWTVAGLLALGVIGLSVALASGSSTPAASRGFAPGSGTSFRGGLNPGVFGTVASVSNGSFTVTSASGQTVTVDEQLSTTYYNGGTSASSGAVTTGGRVAVHGTLSGSTVTATRVTVLPAGGSGPGLSS